jgi:hypothetical protein
MRFGLRFTASIFQTALSPPRHATRVIGITSPGKILNWLSCQEALQCLNPLQLRLALEHKIRRKVLVNCAN